MARQRRRSLASQLGRSTLGLVKQQWCLAERYPCRPFQVGGDETDATGSMASCWWWCEAAKAGWRNLGGIWDEPGCPVVDGVALQVRGTAKATPPSTTILVSRNEMHSKRGHLPLVIQTSAHAALRPYFLEVCQDSSARMIQLGTRPSCPAARCTCKRSPAGNYGKAVPVLQGTTRRCVPGQHLLRRAYLGKMG